MKAEQFKDSIFLDSKKCNAELLTIHADGRITVAEHLKPTETAAEVLRIMRETWMADAQSKKIREQEDRIKQLEDAMGIANTLLQLVMCEQNHLRDVRNKANDRIKELEEAGDALANNHNPFTFIDWLKAKEAQP